MTGDGDARDEIEKLKTERKEALALLDWAVRLIKTAPESLQAGLHPNWTRACLLIANAKAEGII